MKSVKLSTKISIYISGAISALAKGWKHWQRDKLMLCSTLLYLLELYIHRAGPCWEGLLFSSALVYSNRDLVYECGSSNCDNAVKCIVVVIHTESWREVVILIEENTPLLNGNIFRISHLVCESNPIHWVHMHVIYSVFAKMWYMVQMVWTSQLLWYTRVSALSIFWWLTLSLVN